MKYKKGLIFICLIICLLSIASVCAGEITNETNDLTSYENDKPMDDENQFQMYDLNDSSVESDVKDDQTSSKLSYSENENDFLSFEEKNDVLRVSPSYNKYSVTVQDTNIIDEENKNIEIQVSPASGYSYAYDFTLKIYKTSSSTCYSQIFQSSIPTNSLTYYLNSNIPFGEYNMEIVNNADNKVMSTAKLTYKTAPPIKYSYLPKIVNTVVTYDKDTTIIVPIYAPSSTALSYYYKYYFLVKIYDSNGVEKLNRTYQTTNPQPENFITIPVSGLTAGEYTIKTINYLGNVEINTVKLSVLTSPTYNSYSVKSSDTTIIYGKEGNITLNITPTQSAYDNKYDFYLKVYDSKDIEKINERFRSSNSNYHETYTLSPSQLESGVYTIKIINVIDNQIMDTAKLYVLPVSSEAYSVNVSDTLIAYRSGGTISIKIKSAPSSYVFKYDFYLKVYDSNGIEKISTEYSSKVAKASVVYNLKSCQLERGAYTIKLLNSVDNQIMDTANLIILDKQFVTSKYYVNETVKINYTIINTKLKGQFSVYLNDTFVNKVDVGQTIILDYLNEGKYVIKLIYDGDADIPSFQDSCTFYVSKVPLDYYTNYNLVAGTNGNVTFIFKNVPSGKITVYLPNSTNQKYYLADIINGQATITIPELRAGRYDFVLTYDGDDRFETTGNGYIYINHKESQVRIIASDCSWGEIISIMPSLPNDATGYCEIYQDDKYLTKLNVGETYNLSGLNVGKYTIKVIYAGDDYYSSSEYSKSVKVNKIYPKLSLSPIYLINDYIVLNVTINNGATGTIKIKINGATYTETIYNNKATFYFNNLEIDNEYQYGIQYSGDSYFASTEYVSTLRTSLISIQGSVVIPALNNGVGTIKLPSDAKGSITVEIIDKTYKFDIVNGIVNIEIPNLDNGRYSYSVTYSGDSKYSSFRETGILTVNKQNTPTPIVSKIAKTTLTLKKVTVKRSAKKLIIPATLKVNGKAKKGKTIKFKFNKKTYKAKTNAKGIAKVTVKKTVLKKLKKGKKVTYTATYGKITKKVTVKVKK